MDRLTAVMLFVMTYGLFGKMTAIAGKGDALADHLLQAAEALAAVPECRLYVVSRDAEDADSVWVMESWDSKDAHQASLELQAVRDLIASARPILHAVGERFELRPVGGKGLSH